jgi:RNA polymerase sigma-70 factor (ECF subfamily)
VATNVTSPVLDHPLATDAALRQRLLGLARRWLGDVGAAEDLLHDAYLRTAEETSLAPASAGNQEAWLVTVLRNLCFDQLRRQGRYQNILARLGEEEISGFDREQPEHLAAQSQRVDQALLTLVHNLPPEDVAALLLYEVFDFSHAELSALSGRSEAASRQRLHRMMGRLDRETSRGTPEDEDSAALFALCQQALAQCETAALVTLVRTATPQSMAALARNIDHDATTSAQAPRARMIHADNQMALLIQVADGPVTWLPLGEMLLEVA